MKWYKLLALSLLSGLILAFSWYPHGLPFLIFFSFLPLFFMSDALLKKGSKVAFWKGFIFSYPGFLLWNAITTYWICYTTIPGGIAASVLNALLMALVFAAWHCCRKHVQQNWIHPILLISFWMAFEYLHLNWDLTWPWLNLGNVFAVCPQFVQWYSVTGTFGGTLWILACNFLLFYLIKSIKKDKKRTLAYSISVFALWLIPVIISVIQYKTFDQKIDKSTPVEAAILQPNTDVWNEQFRLDNTEQAARMLQIAQPILNDKTNLIVCPESCIPHTISLDALIERTAPTHIPTYGFIPLMDSAIAQHPNLNFILGLSTFKLFDHKASPSADQIGFNQFVELYNTNICYGPTQYNGHHHKSKLVPGVEALPFPKIFGFLSDLLVDLGGSHGSLGKDTCYRVFPINVGDKTLKISSSICYESIYGELATQFVRRGSNILTVSTNDSWWNDSPGHIQHFEMARLRAIENRRYVLRSANGGFSGVIDPMGNVLQKTGYLERTLLKDTVYAQTKLTFYSQHGDYLARLAIVLTFIGLIFSIEEGIRKAIKRHLTSKLKNT